MGKCELSVHILQNTYNELIVKVSGEIDLENVAELRDCSIPNPDTKQEQGWDDVVKHYSRIVFDLSMLSYMDSSGLGFFMGVKRRAQKAQTNPEFVILNPAHSAEKAFCLSGLSRLFRIERVQNAVVATSKKVFPAGSISTGGANFKIEAREAENEAALLLTGELDVYTSPLLKQHIIDQLDKKNVQIQVDLSQLDYIDQTGLGVLIGGLKRARDRNGDLTIICKQCPRIYRILLLTGLTNIFSIDTDEESVAIAYPQSSSAPKNKDAPTKKSKSKSSNMTVREAGRRGGRSTAERKKLGYYKKPDDSNATEN